MNKRNLSTKSAREAAGLEWARSDSRYDHFRVCSGDAIPVSSDLHRTREDAQNWIDAIRRNFIADGLPTPDLYVRGIAR